MQPAIMSNLARADVELIRKEESTEWIRIRKVDSTALVSSGILTRLESHLFYRRETQMVVCV